MSRGRKQKYPGGTEVIPIAFSKEVAARIKDLPNRSDFVNRAVSVALAGIVADTVDYQKKQTRADILLLESALLQQKKRLMGLEEQSETIARTRIDSTDARLKVLEMQHRIKRDPAALRVFFESRLDLLTECDWKSPDEALEWLTENAGKVTR